MKHENKNKFEVVGFDIRVGYQILLLKAIPEEGDPKFDDLPNEQLREGDIVYANFTKVNKEPEEPFNQA